MDSNSPILFYELDLSSRFPVCSYLSVCWCVVLLDVLFSISPFSVYNVADRP